MSDQVTPMNAFLEAIERERRAWDALQHPSAGLPQDNQRLYAAWAHAVSSANVEAERFLKANRSRRRGLSGSPQPGRAHMSWPPAK
ncbi:MAG TPA: hypothetical protein VNN06_04000 [Ramlibacter sp.]|nr:hypothetical protein [Ramlibacter sp.]